MFNHITKFENAWRHYSNFEWGCCCCENIQIAPRVHYASTHSLNTWTRPPPALTLSAMVPDSNSCGWRMAWGAQWCRDCPGDPSATTYYSVCVCVCVHCGTMVFVCLTSLPFVPPWSWQRQWILYLQPQREAFSSDPWNQSSPPSLTRLVTPGDGGQDQELVVLVEA